MKGSINTDKVKIDQACTWFKEGFEKVPNKEEILALNHLVDKFAKSAKSFELLKTKKKLTPAQWELIYEEL